MRPYKFPKKLIALLSFWIAVWLWITLTPTLPILACLPAGRFNYTVTERTHDAELVFEGTVLKTNDLDSTVVEGDFGNIGAGSRTSTGSYGATVAVHQYFKGSGPEIIEIEGFGLGGSCLSSVFPGSNFIFFANGNPSEILTANYLGVYSAVEEANAATIAEAIKATGHLPVEIQHSLKYDAILFFYRFWPFFACLMPIAFISLLWWLIRRRKARQKLTG
ncbi:hypothetical protein [Candidatus Leptofilum sp.]|uniref:hypothetical protein n=1 Tax=Candidatus Leptofilum sp. TaxID=3241576 RepID=UPI003B5A30C9